MTKGDITHSDLATVLVIEGCLAMISGKVQGKAPVAGVPVLPEEREELGLKEPGITIFYATGTGGVFLDMGGSTATVWYNGGDCAVALGVFEAALKRAHPNARYLEDVVNPNNKDMRSRGFQVELGDGGVGGIDVAYPASANGKSGQQFAVRVFAQKRQAV